MDFIIIKLYISIFLNYSIKGKTTFRIDKLYSYIFRFRNSSSYNMVSTGFITTGAISSSLQSFTFLAEGKSRRTRNNLTLPTHYPFRPEKCELVGLNLVR